MQVSCRVQGLGCSKAVGCTVGSSGGRVVGFQGSGPILRFG